MSAVLLLHAGIADSRMWEPQVEVLRAAGYRVLAPDLRGFGQADRFKNSRCDICAMSELTAHTALVRNAFWPTNHHRVTNTAEM